MPTSIGNTGSFNWVNENGGSKKVVVEVAEKPTNWTPNIPASGTNTNEPATSEIFAKDVDNILAVRVGYGGLTFNFTNDSHVIPCDKDGVVQSSANSGGKLEVFLAGVGLNFKANNPSVGEFTISGTSPTEDFVNNLGIQVGAITAETQSNGPTRANIADHTFTGALNNAPFELTEAITYTLTIPQGNGFDDITVTLTQTFTFIKDGDAQGTGLVYLYKKSVNAPAGNELPGTSFPQVKVILATGLIDHSGNDPANNQVFQNGNGGWYTSANGATAAVSGTAPLWIIAATANGVTTTSDFILYNEWSAPVQFTGGDGLSSATVELFQANNNESSAPGFPGDLTYTFNPPALSGSSSAFEGWSETMPSPTSSNPYVWRTSAAAVSVGDDTTIDGVDSGGNADGQDWSTAVIVARYVEASLFSISPEHQLFKKDSDGNFSTETTAIKITAKKINLTGTVNWSGATFYTALSGGSTTTTGDVVYVRASDLGNANSVTVTGTVVYQGATFTDTESIEVVQDGSGALTVSLSNDNVTLTADKDGAVSDFSGSQCTVTVFEGSTKLTPVIESATPDKGEYEISVSTSGIAADTTYVSTDISNDAVSFGVATSIGSSTDTATRTFSITGKSADGTAFTVSKVQGFSKAKQGPTGTSTTGASGTPGQRTVSGVVYYQTAVTDSNAPQVPELTGFSANFTDGTFTYASDWGAAPPTATPGSQTSYYYFHLTISESGNYTSNGWNDVDKTASPTTGSTSIKGIGFTGLVTFSGDNLISGNIAYNPIKYINNTISGEASVTQINGAAIKTGTIQADRFISTPLLAIGSLTPGSDGTLSVTDLEGSNGLNLGAFAKLSSLSLGSASLTGSLPENQGGTGATSYSVAFSNEFDAKGVAFQANIFDGDPSNSRTRLVGAFKNTINASGIALEADIFNGDPSGTANTNSFTTQFKAQLSASGLFLDQTSENNYLNTEITAGSIQLGNVANVNAAGQVQGAFSADTVITAGEITLSTESGTNGGSIVLDSSDKQIVIKDGSNNPRVILGKLT